MLLALPLLGFASEPAWAHGPATHEIEVLTEAIDSGSARALDVLRRGELHRVMGHWQAAVEDYDRAERLDPTLSDVQVCRAALRLDRGEAREARRLLDRVLEISPRHLRARELRARTLEKLGRKRDAAADLDVVIAAQPDPKPDLLVTRAWLLAGCGARWTPRAIAGLDWGIARLGPLASLEIAAIDLELRRGDSVAALARLETLVNQIALHDYLERRGRILAAAGRDRESREAFAAALAEIESLPRHRRDHPTLQTQAARLRASLEEGGHP